MYTKADIVEGVPGTFHILVKEDGAFDLPVASTLPHRFEVVEGVIVEKEKYVGLTDNEVRELDHDEAQAEREALIVAWDALSEEEKEVAGPRPTPLPELTLPEE